MKFNNVETNRVLKRFEVTLNEAIRLEEEDIFHQILNTIQIKSDFKFKYIERIEIINDDVIFHLKK